MAEEKIKGPASYFPSIEKKYGHPVAHWFQLLDTRSGMKHMELVAWLKDEHQLGHGHANALVAYHLNKRAPDQGLPRV
jgi:hypothetical protein